MKAHTNHDEIFAAIQQIASQADEEREPNVFTTRELADAMSCSEQYSRNTITALLKKNLIEHVRIPYTDIIGRRTWLSAWKWLGETDAKGPFVVGVPRA